MKLTLTTLTGEKHEVEVSPEDSVKNVKKQLYLGGRVTGQVRLLYGQKILQDERPIQEYGLPLEGAVVSALFEPDEEVNIEVSTAPGKHQLVVTNSTLVMALKVQISEVTKCGISPQKMELMFGEVTLENSLPLHYFNVISGSKLSVVRPYITVSIEDNYGDIICKRLSKKDTIEEVKVKLSSGVRSPSPTPPMEELLEGQGPPPGPHGHPPGRRGHHHPPHHHGPRPRMMHMRALLERTKMAAAARHPSVDDMRLYVITTNGNSYTYGELCDDVTVQEYNLHNNAQLYLLSYKWTNQRTYNVTTSAGVKRLLGVEPEDTLQSVRVRVQDQMATPAGTVELKVPAGGTVDLVWGKVSSVGNNITIHAP